MNSPYCKGKGSSGLDLKKELCAPVRIVHSKAGERRIVQFDGTHVYEWPIDWMMVRRRRSRAECREDQRQLCSCCCGVELVARAHRIDNIIPELIAKAPHVDAYPGICKQLELLPYGGHCNATPPATGRFVKAGQIINELNGG